MTAELARVGHEARSADYFEGTDLEMPSVVLALHLVRLKLDGLKAGLTIRRSGCEGQNFAKSIHLTGFGGSS